MTQIAETEQTERSKVQSWRLHVLIEAGYPLPLAEKLGSSGRDVITAYMLGTEVQFFQRLVSCRSQQDAAGDLVPRDVCVAAP